MPLADRWPDLHHGGVTDQEGVIMQVLVHFPWENGEEWVDELRLQAAGHRILLQSDHPDPAQIEATVVWKPPAGFFSGMDKLRAVIVPGAGVDHLFASGATFPDVPIVRLADPVMATRMAEYVLAMVLDHHRELGRYRRQQGEAVWTRHFHRDPGDIRVGILGMGVMGMAAARHLRAIGYAVTGWSRSAKAAADIDADIDLVAGDAALLPLVENSDFLVCLLPLTEATRGILSKRIFEALPEGALLINAARGAHLVVTDLLSALDRGRPGAAVLDVFEDEPLSANSPLWRHPAITITPHIASLSNPVTGVRQIVRALDRLDAGEQPDHLVDRDSGY